MPETAAAGRERWRGSGVDRLSGHHGPSLLDVYVNVN
jgi:hypothetical protein